MAKAKELFSNELQIHKIQVIASKWDFRLKRNRPVAAFQLRDFRWWLRIYFETA